MIWRFSLDQLTPSNMLYPSIPVFGFLLFVGQISVLEDLACRRVPIKYMKLEYHAIPLAGNV